MFEPYRPPYNSSCRNNPSTSGTIYRAIRVSISS